jgi:hypothetical protein
MMRHRARQVRQLELFGEQPPTIDDQRAPAWQALPEETRRVLTGLMSRLLLAHYNVEPLPFGAEADDV